MPRKISDDEKLVATKLHGLLCRANHTDECRWSYFKWGEADNDRSHWVTMARKALKVTDAKTIVDLMHVADPTLRKRWQNVQ